MIVVSVQVYEPSLYLCIILPQSVSGTSVLPCKSKFIKLTHSIHQNKILFILHLSVSISSCSSVGRAPGC